MPSSPHPKTTFSRLADSVGTLDGDSGAVASEGAEEPIGVSVGETVSVGAGEKVGLEVGRSDTVGAVEAVGAGVVGEPFGLVVPSVGSVGTVVEKTGDMEGVESGNGVIDGVEGAGGCVGMDIKS